MNLIQGWKGFLLSVMSGAALVLAFAPFKFWFVAPLSLAAFFLLLLPVSAGAAAWRGYGFGLGLYGAGVSWVYVSLSTFGGMPLWMGSIAVLGFASLLAGFIAVMSYLVARLFPARSWYRFLVLPVIWIVFEWLKSWVLTGFPWLDIGYTVVDTWLAAWAPIGGIYLVSFLVAALAAALAASLLYRSRSAMLVLPMIVFASWLVNMVDWSEPSPYALKVGVIQANVSIDEKWEPDYRRAVIDNYRSVLRALKDQQKVDLVVLPETAIPMHLQYLDLGFWESLVPQGTAVLAGVIDTPSLLTEPSNFDESYNAAFFTCGQTEPLQVYRKRHLVPFGEYLPLRFLFQWVLDYLNLPMSDFSAWQGDQALSCGDQIKVGLSICYEDAFANEYRQSLGAATVLVNISEDAWFGDSFAPHQRLQMAQMRARELARPMVRSANSGPSAFIDYRGRIESISGQFAPATLVQYVQPQTGTTWFLRFGNWFVYVMLALLGVIGLRQWARRAS
ncbi:apolipoprotein N-acyltransferase [Arenicella chitinivorans]|uniref:Apolipoprotein N-acyltransferase n=1 Tax=Arenicella chitinivorans TaxID=1329800 RepID=A0A918RMD2_9GAMM|nr:apolipoprotein N-acyltransferase [Arenicella chitinivorans]GHA04094.1 apolipoprotein N-acyltransferase [Arenicella chitinivorans]